MKSNTKSSVTLPKDALDRLLRLRRRLRLSSNVEVVRRGLQLLEEKTEREALREAYAKASLATRAGTREELAELDHLAGEGLDA
jgi:Arc/MetJ-type ribon-helix-helix transcriptional regulator